MPIVCWGNLAKSATSTERIEQSISGYVMRHDVNPNAHMGEDYSLGVHRLETVLDHIDGSVNLRKLSETKYVAISAFESIDAWSYVGNLGGGLMSRMIKIKSNEDVAYWRTPVTVTPIKVDYSKNPFFQTSFVSNQTTAHEFWAVMGGDPADDSDDSFGFYIDQVTVYAIWTCEGVEHTVELSDINTQIVNTYRAYYDSTEEKLYFIVNGVEKLVVEADLPTTTNDRLFSYYMSSPDTTGNYMYYIADLMLQMDR